MTLVDATDGILMLGAYGWAFVRPIRKLYYNLTITLISVIVAFVIGGLEILSIVAGQLSLSGGVRDLAGWTSSSWATSSVGCSRPSG